MRGIVWLGMLLASCQNSAPSDHVVLVSIDGLRPDFYLDEKYDAPTLRRLAREGAHVRGVESVYPSVTYPSHATIVTGVRPATHGILNNTQWTKDGPVSDWYWDADQIRAPPLWKIVREAGKTSAIVYWPVTVGAEADWVIPERWPKEGEGSQRDVLANVSTEGLVDEIEKALGPFAPRKSFDKVYSDEYFTETLAHLIKARKPNFSLLHLIQVDGAQHEHGREHAEVTAAVERVDGLVATLLKAIEEAGTADRTTLIITGDHGFIDVQHTFYPNALFKEMGWYRSDRDWDVIAHQGGAQATVYVRKPELVEAVGKALEEQRVREGVATFTLLDRDALDKLGAAPEAAFAISGNDGYTISGGANRRTFFGDSNKVTGNHGPLPEEPKLHTGLIVNGAGVRGGASLDRARLIDVAPTVAKLLGVEMKDVEGRVLAELLK